VTARIVVVEDDPSVAELVTLYLRNAEFIVAHARTAAEARVKFDEERPAHCHLDLGLPDANGLDLLREIRKHAGYTRSRADRARGDVQKSKHWIRHGRLHDETVQPKELVARVRAILRRTAGMPEVAGRSSSATCASIQRATRCMSASARSRSARRSSSFSRPFCRQPGIVLTRDRLLEDVWASPIRERRAPSMST